jgi:hypothetical protein
LRYFSERRKSTYPPREAKVQTAESTKSSSPAQALLGLTSGYWISQAIYVVAKLGIADFLEDGAKNCDELAQATNSHTQSLARVMRNLASIGVFTEVDTGRFGLTPLAEPLRSGAADSMRAWAIMLGEESYSAWGELLYAVKTGKPAFDQVYKMRRFEYLKRHPDAVLRAMPRHLQSCLTSTCSSLQEAVNAPRANIGRYLDWRTFD